MACVNTVDKPQTFDSPVIHRKNVNKHVARNVIFLWKLLQNNYDFVLADSAEATSGEAPAPLIDAALHCTLCTQHCKVGARMSE